MLTRGFTVAGVQCRVCALDDWRSRPTVALRVRLRASPSAQDDTEGRGYAISMPGTTIMQWLSPQCLLTYNAETNESLLQWEKVAAAG